MAFDYESPEFSDELQRKLNSDKEFREKAKGMSWKTLFIVKDVPFATYSSYVDGELVERKHVFSSEIDETRKKADFTVEIPTFDLSVDVATGRKSLESLFLSRQIKLEGSIFKALQCRGAIERGGKITTALVNESNVPSKEAFINILRKSKLL